IRPINAHARSFSSSNSSLSFYVTGSIAHSSKSAKMLVDYMIETVENAQRTFQVGFANEFLQYRQTIGFSDFIAFEIRINRSLENVFAFKQNSVSISQDDVENPFLERFRYHGFNYFNMPVPDQEHRSVYFKITNSTDIQSPQGAMFVQIIIAI
ncbi:MAG: hypothetical protein FWC11_06475, partial [Firmicutes bacterium]|nr:hypothetical protein [Bacillota bacterium]